MTVQWSDEAAYREALRAKVLTIEQHWRSAVERCVQARLLEREEAQGLRPIIRIAADDRRGRSELDEQSLPDVKAIERK